MSERFTTTLDETLDRQKLGWLQGSRPQIDDLLRRSSLAPSAETVLDLIYNEVVVREELGETPHFEEYAARFPHLSDSLRIQFEVHRAVSDDLLESTRPENGLPPVFEEKKGFYFGPQLAEYEIVEELGRGGMGVVYKARHRALKRFVALKMILPGRVPSPRESVRFRSEADNIARLHHPNIIQIFDVGEDNGQTYFSLEFAEGGTLEQRLLEQPLPPREAAALVESLAQAVQHAHEHHIVHRDLKPANVLFHADGRPVITDFGLAKLL